MAKPGVFLREATGLVREIGSMDATILAIGGIIGPTWIIGFASMWFLFPGVSVAAAFAIMGTLCALHGIYYILITAVMPRSGGGAYVPLSRTIHPAFGLGMSFVMVFAYIFNVAAVASFTVNAGILGPISTYGIVTHNTGLVDLATALSTPTMTLVTGTITLILVLSVLVAGTRVMMRINKIAIVIGNLGFAAVYYILLTTNQDYFRTAYNNFVGSTSAYEDVILAAQSGGLSIPANWLTPTLLALPLAFFMITSYQSGTYYSGEIRRITRSMPISVIGSIIYGAIVFSSMAFLMERSFGGDFVKSLVYLFNAQPSQYPLAIAPWVSSFVVLLNSNVILTAIMVAGFTAFGYLLMIVLAFIPSRHFFAWSFDRVFPSRLSDVSDRFHTPVIAVLCIGAICEVALVFYVFLPTVLAPVNLTFFFIVAWMLDGLAGIALPWRARGTFERAPAIARKKIAGIPVIAIAGAYDVILVFSLFLMCLYNPTASGPLGIGTMASLLAVFILGVLVFYGMKTYHARQGLDIMLAFKEIPPE
jgi:amino acid transporter